MDVHVRLSERQRLTQIPVTLDGKPARVTGYRNEFATVRNQQYGVEFAWATVAHIIANRGGKFES
ncbi:MAG TPA: hypothetical protein VHK27_04995 [Gammaproteobacteria bacterium]|nr:hypothetical protein [Gammaproteobacteria bacterium]